MAARRAPGRRAGPAGRAAGPARPSSHGRTASTYATHSRLVSTRKTNSSSSARPNESAEATTAAEPGQRHDGPRERHGEAGQGRAAILAGTFGVAHGAHGGYVATYDAAQGGTRSWRARVLSRGPDPVLVVDLLQSAKTALAGVLAWVVALDVLGLEQPFLAPWAAVLVVHATVYRTVSRGGQQVAATFAGVFLAWGCGGLFGVGRLGMARDARGRVPARAAPLAARRGDHHRHDRHRRPGDQRHRPLQPAGQPAARHHGRRRGRPAGQPAGLAAAARPGRLGAGRASCPHELAGRAGGDGRRASARTCTPEDAGARGSRGCATVDVRIDEAWRLLGQARESSRFNPRRSQPAGLDDLMRTLHLLEQAVADTLSMARTMATSAENATLWDEDFRSPWKRLLAETAAAVERPRRGPAAGDRAPSSAGSPTSSPPTRCRARPGTSTAACWSTSATWSAALAQVTEWSKGSARSPVRSKRSRADVRRGTSFAAPGAGTPGAMMTPDHHLTSAAEHQRPDGVSDETVSALGKLSEALEAVEDARGHLYAFHRLCGTADLTLGEAVEELREAGHTELADQIEQRAGRPQHPRGTVELPGRRGVRRHLLLGLQGSSRSRPATSSSTAGGTCSRRR